MDQRKMYEQTLDAASKVVAGVAPDQLGNPTPCEAWDVRALLNHMIGGAHYFAEAARSGKGPAIEGDGSDTDFVGDDPAASFDEGRSAVAGAWPDDMDRPTELLFGTVPASAAQGIHMMDTFVHTWDLARATGQDADLDRAIAEELLERARTGIPEAMRGTIFAAEQPCDPDRTPADRLAAYLGRAV